MKNLILCFWAMLLLSAPVYSARSKDDSIPRATAEEVLETMHRSRLVYVIETVETLASKPRKVYNEELYFDDSDIAQPVKTLQLSDSARAVSRAAFEAFDSYRYYEQLTLLRQLADEAPEFQQFHLYMAYTFLIIGELDSAFHYSRLAIERNFTYYLGHWSLGMCYVSNRMLDSAITYLTNAHTLNRNHADIYDMLRMSRLQAGRGFNEWEFRPTYDLDRIGDTVYVRTPERWFWYATIMALWHYEPGYADSMTLGEDIGVPPERHLVAVHNAISLTVEANLGHHYRLQEIFDAGYFVPFVQYEIWAPELPMILIGLPREDFYRVIEYVDRFH